MAEAPTSAFSHTQYDDAYPPGIERHWWMRARADMVDALIRERGEAGGILEIGCGSGATLALLRARGHDCRGVEIADIEPLEEVRPFITKACDAVDLPESARLGVSTILLLDVIEHIDDDAGFLRRIAQAFPRLRRVIVTTPARREIWSNYDEYYGHRRRYDLQALKALGAAQGWRAPHAGYAFRISYPPALLLSAFNIPRSTKFVAPSGVAVALHRALAALTLWEWRLLPRALPGTSAIAAFDAL